MARSSADWRPAAGESLQGDVNGRATGRGGDSPTKSADDLGRMEEKIESSASLD